MNKLLKFVLLVIMSISIFVACSSDDNDDNGATIEPTQLPTQARSFVSDYFFSL